MSQRKSVLLGDLTLRVVLFDFLFTGNYDFFFLFFCFLMGFCRGGVWGGGGGIEGTFFFFSLFILYFIWPAL